MGTCFPLIDRAGAISADDDLAQEASWHVPAAQQVQDQLTEWLIAQGAGPVEAAQLGVYVHGLAGDLAAAELTERGMIAGDLIQRLPDAWRLIEGRFDV